MNNALGTLVHMLNSNEVSVIMCIGGILSNLTCNNSQNKTYLCKIGTIQALLRVLSAYCDREDIIEPAVSLLLQMILIILIQIVSLEVKHTHTYLLSFKYNYQFVTNIYLISYR